MKNDFVVYFGERSLVNAAIQQYVSEVSQQYPQLNLQLDAKFVGEHFVEDDIIPIVVANYHFPGYPVVMKNGKYFGRIDELYDEIKRLKVLAKYDLQ